MPKRQVNYRKLRKSSIGDMRTRISLENRSISAPNFDTVAFDENYTQIIETWAKVETEFNNRIFDGIAIDAIPSHKFTIRYRDDITSETRIRYSDVLYRIQKTDNLEMRNEYLILYASIDGDDTKAAAQ